MTIGTANWVRSMFVMLALTLNGCGEEAADSAPQANVDANPRAPGALPTHEISFRLLSKGQVERFEHIQRLFGENGQRCTTVLSATLKGGMDGLDEWRVKCADTGEWELWLKPEGHDILPAGTSVVSPADQ